MTDRTRIFIEVSGGNVQRIISDQDIEIVLIDYDNANDADDPIKFDEVEDALVPKHRRGSAIDFDEVICETRNALEEIANKNKGPAAG